MEGGPCCMTFAGKNNPGLITVFPWHCVDVTKVLWGHQKLVKIFGFKEAIPLCFLWVAREKSNRVASCEMQLVSHKHDRQVEVPSLCHAQEHTSVSSFFHPKRFSDQQQDICVTISDHSVASVWRQCRINLGYASSWLLSSHNRVWTLDLCFRSKTSTNNSHFLRGAVAVRAFDRDWVSCLVFSWCKRVRPFVREWYVSVFVQTPNWPRLLCMFDPRSNFNGNISEPIEGNINAAVGLALVAGKWASQFHLKSHQRFHLSVLWNLKRIPSYSWDA